VMMVNAARIHFVSNRANQRITVVCSTPTAVQERAKATDAVDSLIESLSAVAAMDRPRPCPPAITAYSHRIASIEHE